MNPENMTVAEMKFVLKTMEVFFDEGVSFDPYDLHAALADFRKEQATIAKVSDDDENSG
jgi:hypothetical protein